MVVVRSQRKQPSAVFRSAASTQQLEELEELISEVKLDGKSELVKQHRNFGEHQLSSTGHEVTYLHEHASDSTRGWLKHMLSLSLPRLGFADLSTEKLSLRCLEAVDYYPDGQSIHDLLVAGMNVGRESSNKESALGFHRDGATVCTMSIALSTAGEDFEGGDFELRGATQEPCVLRCARRGDVVAWRGWDEHRVKPVRRGRRCVVVAEWWFGPSCSQGGERPEDTVEVVQRSLLQDCGTVPLSILLGRLLIESNDLESAKGSYARALQIMPTVVEAHVGLAQVAERRGDLEVAEAHYRSAIEIDPKSSTLHNQLGAVMAGQGFYVSAANCFKLAIKHDPLFFEAEMNLAMSLVEAGRVEEAMRSLEVAFRLRPRSVDLEYFVTRARVIAERDATTAAKIYTTVLSLDPGNVEACAGLGKV